MSAVRDLEQVLIDVAWNGPVCGTIVSLIAYVNPIAIITFGMLAAGLNEPIDWALRNQALSSPIRSDRVLRAALRAIAALGAAWAVASVFGFSLSLSVMVLVCGVSSLATLGMRAVGAVFFPTQRRILGVSNILGERNN